jgi:hypothetical protein
MKKDDLVKWFTAQQAVFGPNKDYGVGDNSSKNSATIDATTGKGPKTKMPMPKLGIKEDIDNMFIDQDLSEEFKEKITTIFEAAVSARTMVEIARLEEEFETTLEESIIEIMEDVTDKVDTYLDFVVENWMKENEVAVESTLRNELVSDFIDGLKGLFAEHYIDVPQDKVDVLETMAEKIEELEAKYDSLVYENVELKNSFVEVEKDNVLESHLSSLALSQQEKFKALAESVDFDGNLETYARKLSIIKENYFGVEKKATTSTNITEETFEGDTAVAVSAVDPTVNKYVQALSRTIKK